MDGLVLHETTRSHVEHFVNGPAHAVLLAGPTGIGKTAVAEALIATLLGIRSDALAAYPHYLVLRADGSSISIEAIRQLQKFLQLKTAGDRPFRRAVLIEQAHTLTTEAQNAFLKLLEEPPADTLMVLTVKSPRALLPTILSRAQAITVHVPSEAQLQTLIAGSAKDETTRKQAYFLSGGLPGLLSALLADDQEHPLLASVAQAKDLLQKTPYERLATVDALSKQKDMALGVVESLERIAQAGLAGAAAKQDTVRLAKWHHIRKCSLEARHALQRSANTKLTLSNLFLHL